MKLLMNAAGILLSAYAVFVCAFSLIAFLAFIAVVIGTVGMFAAAFISLIL